jgi:uncharacterized ion transporter superfamily protein YfcC
MKKIINIIFVLMFIVLIISIGTTNVYLLAIAEVFLISIIILDIINYYKGRNY